MKPHRQAAHEATQHALHAKTTAHNLHSPSSHSTVNDIRPRRTVLVGRIIGGEWTTQGLHHFCEHCHKYMQGHDLECPHCGKETL